MKILTWNCFSWFYKVFHFINIVNIDRAEIYVSGDLSPDDIKKYVDEESPVSGFGIDNYIARGSKINFRADIKQIDGNDIARRGRKPGSTNATPLSNPIPPKPKDKEDDLSVENLELETNEDVIEDDTVLIEEESDIDPAVDVGIKPTEDKEEF